MHKIRTFREGHSTVGEWQGRGRGTAGERHGMCESAFRVAATQRYQHLVTWVTQNDCCADRCRI
jgi:hypothetical protein